MSHLVTSWSMVDSGGLQQIWETLMDSGGLWWTPADSGGLHYMLCCLTLNRMLINNYKQIHAYCMFLESGTNTDQQLYSYCKFLESGTDTDQQL